MDDLYAVSSFFGILTEITHWNWSAANTQYGARYLPGSQGHWADSGYGTLGEFVPGFGIHSVTGPTTPLLVTPTLDDALDSERLTGLKTTDRLKRGDYGLDLSHLQGPGAEKHRTVPGQDSVTFLIACFAAGTPILTPYGHQPIESLQMGDRVWSRPEDQPDAPPRVQVVEEVFRSTSALVRLHIGGRVIDTTELHPFFVVDHGWTAARDLQVGQLIRSHNGLAQTVQFLERSPQEVPVFNIRVSEDHTYFVGAANWGWSLWAHNECDAVEAPGNKGAQENAAAPTERGSNGGPRTATTSRAYSPAARFYMAYRGPNIYELDAGTGEWMPHYWRLGPNAARNREQFRRESELAKTGTLEFYLQRADRLIRIGSQGKDPDGKGGLSESYYSDAVYDFLLAEAARQAFFPNMPYYDGIAYGHYLIKDVKEEVHGSIRPTLSAEGLMYEHYRDVAEKHGLLTLTFMPGGLMDMSLPFASAGAQRFQVARGNSAGQSPLPLAPKAHGAPLESLRTHNSLHLKNVMLHLGDGTTLVFGRPWLSQRGTTILVLDAMISRRTCLSVPSLTLTKHRASTLQPRKVMPTMSKIQPLLI